MLKKKTFGFVLLKLLCIISITISAYATTYTYDALGRLKEIQYESGNQVIYTYDKNGNATKTWINKSGKVPTSKPQITTSSSELTPGEIGKYYNAVIRADYSQSVFTLTKGQLPTGMRLFPNGAIIGTPTAIGTSHFSVTAANSVGESLEVAFFISIVSADKPTPTPTSTPRPTAAPTLTPWPTVAPTSIPTPTPTPVAIPEQVDAFTIRMYKFVLGREPDEEGLNFWVDGLLSGAETAASIVDNFLFSTEFLTRNTSNEQFLVIAYNTLLGREPEPEGFAFWLNALENGFSRRYIMDEMLMSPEFTNICAEYTITLGPVIGVEGFVVRMYKNVLVRNYDAEGLHFWVNGLRLGKENGATIAEKFFFSEEFSERDVSNTKFLEIAYHTFMNREPDAVGKAYWIDVLESGFSRREVLSFMINDTEFEDICAGYGIEAGKLSR